jgi:predicted GNAT family N-acyltransferase
MSKSNSKSRRYLQGAVASNRVTVEVARDLNTLMQVIALRAIVYMGEQLCPFEEEFDGNDFTAATHLVAYINGQAVGALRLRWFADFVKVERVAVRADHRGGEVVRALFGAAIEVARRRGYRRALGYIQVRLVAFWRRLGFYPREGRAPFAFSDHHYIEVEGEIEPHPAPLSIDADPMVLMRPDGLWDFEGVLDRSTARPATNPCS